MSFVITLTNGDEVKIPKNVVKNSTKLTKLKEEGTLNLKDFAVDEESLKIIADYYTRKKNWEKEFQKEFLNEENLPGPKVFPPGEQFPVPQTSGPETPLFKLTLAVDYLQCKELGDIISKEFVNRLMKLQPSQIIEYFSAEYHFPDQDTKEIIRKRRRE